MPDRKKEKRPYGMIDFIGGKLLGPYEVLTDAQLIERGTQMLRESLEPLKCVFMTDEDIDVMLREEL